MIKISIHLDSPGFGGSEINLMRVLDMLSAHNAAFRVYCNPDTDLRLLSYFKFNQISYTFDYTPNRQMYLLTGLFKTLKRCLFDDATVYIIWAHHLNSSRWVQLGLALAKKKFLVVEQLVPAQRAEVVRAKLTPIIKRIVAERAQKIILNGFSQINHYTQLLGLSNAGRGRLMAIPNSRDVRAIAKAVANFKPTNTALRDQHGIPPGNTVVCIARLTTQKGQRYLLEAVHQLVQQQPPKEFNLVLVGNGEDELTLKSLVQEYGLPLIYFVGEQRDVLPWLALADVFVLPSLSEGLPGGLIEAMAASLPCVATDIPGNNELVIDGVTGLLVPSEAPGAIANALDKLLAGIGLREELANNGFRHVCDHYDESIEKAAWLTTFAEFYK